jgi:hypothetical protein
MLNFKKTNLNKVLLVVAMAIVFFSAKNVLAASTFNYTLLESFPGFFTEGAVMTDLPKMILAIYKFGIWTIGIAGLLMITVGGIMYAGSAGNTATATKAKGIITDALIGIAAAMSAYLFLYVINPDLTNLKINFTAVKVEETTGTGLSTPGTAAGKSTGSTITGGPCLGTNAGCCKAGTKCADCKNCGNFSNSYSSLCYKGAPGNTGCKLNTSLAGKLNSANLSSVNAEASEVWPPTVYHASACHQDGTCADVRCKKGCANETVANVKKIYDALKNAGLTPVFESTSCAQYTAAGIYCKYYSTMTGASFHVNM